ncbi:MAG TPA: DUF4365 domain-containing protein [Longimicrobium sp.]|nr:DUF4365 domain-containing protein [Longimicrobium sp.]
MAYPKRRVRQHIMEDRSIRIVRDLLPDHWVIRDYKPDYGIDLTIELFEFLEQEPDQAATLGETVFVQVKSTEAVDVRRLRVQARQNVEKGPLRENSARSVEIEVAALQLETSELLTVQAMGSAVPVLLFLVELSTRRIYFVCLNDVIEKVILPQDPSYAAKESKVLHIPLANCIRAEDPVSIRPLETYAKRPKLYAAFEKLAYQHHELGHALLRCTDAAPEDDQRAAATAALDLVRHFLAVILRYDFWTRIPEWQPIGHSYGELTALQGLLVAKGVEHDLLALQTYLMYEPAMNRSQEWVRSMRLEDARRQVLLHVSQLWHRLANLSRIYEEMGREWFLPTYLAPLLVEI